MVVTVMENTLRKHFLISIQSKNIVSEQTEYLFVFKIRFVVVPLIV